MAELVINGQNGVTVDVASCVWTIDGLTTFGATDPAAAPTTTTEVNFYYNTTDMSLWIWNPTSMAWERSDDCCPDMPIVVPDVTFADPDSPTTAEALVYALTQNPTPDAGTLFIYNPASGTGTADTPDYVWYWDEDGMGLTRIESPAAALGGTYHNDEVATTFNTAAPPADPQNPPGGESEGETMIERYANGQAYWTYTAGDWVLDWFFEDCCVDGPIEIPDAAFADPDSPTPAEAEIWIAANGTGVVGQLYYQNTPAGTGTANNPDFVYYDDGDGTATEIESLAGGGAFNNFSFADEDARTLVVNDGQVVTLHRSLHLGDDTGTVTPAGVIGVSHADSVNTGVGTGDVSNNHVNVVLGSIGSQAGTAQTGVYSSDDGNVITSANSAALASLTVTITSAAQAAIIASDPSVITGGTQVAIIASEDASSVGGTDNSAIIASLASTFTSSPTRSAIVASSTSSIVNGDVRFIAASIGSSITNNYNTNAIIGAGASNISGGSESSIIGGTSHTIAENAVTNADRNIVLGGEFADMEDSRWGAGLSSRTGQWTAGGSGNLVSTAVDIASENVTFDATDNSFSRVISGASTGNSFTGTAGVSLTLSAAFASSSAAISAGDRVFVAASNLATMSALSGGEVIQSVILASSGTPMMTAGANSISRSVIVGSNNSSTVDATTATVSQAMIMATDFGTIRNGVNSGALIANGANAVAAADTLIQTSDAAMIAASDASSITASDNAAVISSDHVTISGASTHATAIATGAAGGNNSITLSSAGSALIAGEVVNIANSVRSAIIASDNSDMNTSGATKMIAASDNGEIRGSTNSAIVAGLNVTITGGDNVFIAGSRDGTYDVTNFAAGDLWGTDNSIIDANGSLVARAGMIASEAVDIGGSLTGNNVTHAATLGLSQSTIQGAQRVVSIAGRNVDIDTPAEMIFTMGINHTLTADADRMVAIGANVTYTDNGTGAQQDRISMGQDIVSDADHMIALGHNNNHTNAGGIASYFNYSFGRGCNVNHRGSMVLADGNTAAAVPIAIASAADNELTQRFQGGFRLFSNAAATTGQTMAAGASVWVAVSDRSVKNDHGILDPAVAGSLVDTVDSYRWSFIDDPDQQIYTGPYANDINAALDEDQMFTAKKFMQGGTGDGDMDPEELDALSDKDLIGVLWSALKGSRSKVVDMESRMDALEARIAALEAA